MKRMQNKWDKKAHRYGRYTTESDTLETIICGMMAEMGVDFSGKRVVDIGCGTGVYTLRVAQKAAQVDALDISEEMLKILREDAKNHGLTNIQTHHSDWIDFPLPDVPYDYALSTMSPATRDRAGFARIHEAATTRIFLGWGDKRGTGLLEELFAAAGQTYTPPNGAVKLRAWLEEHAIPYRLREYAETKTRIRSLPKAIEAYSWRVEAHGSTPDPALVEAVLRRYLDNEGNVVERVINYFNLIVW